MAELKEVILEGIFRFGCFEKMYWLNDLKKIKWVDKFWKYNRIGRSSLSSLLFSESIEQYSERSHLYRVKKDYAFRAEFILIPNI